MTFSRIISLQVRGFRAFGVAEAHFALDAPLTVAHAGNSQGKTSLAEAIEFLFSGRSSRRELLGGAKAEYNDSLRNAHLPVSDDAVYVKAVVRTSDGSLHEVRRDLTCDFGRGAECESRLEIDGHEVQDLSSVGLVLADPPVRAPVLLQHILRHALSTEPKQRVSYFKSLLSLSDLDVLRERVGDARKRLERESLGPWRLRLGGLPPDLQAVRDRVAMIIEGPALQRSDLLQVLTSSLRDLASAAAGEPYASLTESREGLDRLARAKAEAIFPLGWFATAVAPASNPQPPQLVAYGDALAAVEAETARLLPIFSALLRVDEFADAEAARDCPVCATPDALTPERIATIRREVVRTSDLDEASAAALQSVEAAQSALTELAQFVQTGVPSAGVVRETGVAELEAQLLTLRVDPTVMHSALATAREMAESAAKLVAVGREVRTLLASTRLAIESRKPAPSPTEVYGALGRALEQVRSSQSRHVVALSALNEAVTPIVSMRQELSDHRQLRQMLDGVEALVEEIIVGWRRRTALTRVRAAEKSLADASAHLLDARFAEMSDTIKKWWLTIRPEELVDFLGVRRRAGGAMFVNLIAALHAESGANPVERDALGVYSDSQLNALGLSIFLARAELLGSALVVLDDPITGSDSDHRLTFVQNTMTELLDSGVQVILTTHDGKLADWAMSNHDHRGLIGFELNLIDPRLGTVATQTSDMFSRLLLDAEDNLNAPTARGRRAACGSYRAAAERLAKQIIATGRTHAGTLSSVADVDAEASMLGDLVPLVRGFALDNGEKGQWKTFAKVLNPGNHDDDVPSTVELKQVRGNLRKIAKGHREHWPNGLIA